MRPLNHSVLHIQFNHHTFPVTNFKAINAYHPENIGYLDPNPEKNIISVLTQHNYLLQGFSNSTWQTFFYNTSLDDSIFTPVNVFVNVKPVYFRENNNNNNPDPLKNTSLPPAPVPPPKIDRRLKPFNRPGSGDSATLPAGEIVNLRTLGIRPIEEY